MIDERADEVLRFWFTEIDASLWWRKDKHFDGLIGERFGLLHQQASSCELYGWRESAQGRLAEIIILDQFSRNIYRDEGRAFACDPLALGLAQETIRLKLDEQLSSVQRGFLYLPFMHSESRVIHEAAVELFQQKGTEASYQFELKHKVIIDRFGRYPHRNHILGRTSTKEEIEFLKQPDSSF